MSLDAQATIAFFLQAAEAATKAGEWAQAREYLDAVFGAFPEQWRPVQEEAWTRLDRAVFDALA